MSSSTRTPGKSSSSSYTLLLTRRYVALVSRKPRDQSRSSGVTSGKRRRDVIVHCCLHNTGVKAARRATRRPLRLEHLLAACNRSRRRGLRFETQAAVSGLNSPPTASGVLSLEETWPMPTPRLVDGDGDGACLVLRVKGSQPLCLLLLKHGLPVPFVAAMRPLLRR